MILILVLSQGIFLVWSIYLSIRKLRFVDKGFITLHRAPLFLIMAYILTMIVAPLPHFGDSTEFTQRSFIALYIFLVLYCLLFSQFIDKHTLIFFGFVTLLYCFSNYAQRSYGQTMPENEWYYSDSQNFEISKDMIDISEFMKNKYRQGDSFLLYPQLDNDYSLSDSIKISSLSSVPVFLSRPAFYLSVKNVVINEEIKNRLSLISSLGVDGINSSLIPKLKSQGVRWIVYDSKYLISNTSNLNIRKFGKYNLIDLYSDQ